VRDVEEMEERIRKYGFQLDAHLLGDGKFILVSLFLDVLNVSIKMRQLSWASNVLTGMYWKS